MARTRIVATVGPACRSEGQLRELAEAGVDIFRLNFAHGTHPEHKENIRAIRRAVGSRAVAILQDLGGPKLRLKHPVKGQPGDLVEIALPSTVKPGDPVLLADGIMQLEVARGGRCRVVTGGDIPKGKGINLPSSRLDIPSLTPKDRRDLKFGVSQGVDLISLSFVRRASDLDAVRKSGRPVIAKIEKAEAVENLVEIVLASDGVMVARGDLGVEIPIERVPAVQKRVIALSNRLGKPVITATQMLRSMVDSPRPTRAEATDVANAVLDGTDAVMLSEETAVGRYGPEAVRVMERILVEIEPLLAPRSFDGGSDVSEGVARAACDMAAQVKAEAIVVVTGSGASACRVSQFRPAIPVIALTPDERVRRRLSLVWGVTALKIPRFRDEVALLKGFGAMMRRTRQVRAGATIVVVAGWPSQPGRGVNLLHVTKV